MTNEKLAWLLYSVLVLSKGTTDKIKKKISTNYRRQVCPAKKNNI